MVVKQNFNREKRNHNFNLILKVKNGYIFIYFLFLGCKKVIIIKRNINFSFSLSVGCNLIFGKIRIKKNIRKMGCPEAVAYSFIFLFNENDEEVITLIRLG